MTLTEWNEVIDSVRARYGILQSQFEIIEAMKFLKPRKLFNFLEIGSNDGGSFACWSMIISGKKISIDIPYPGVNYDKRNTLWLEDFDNVYPVYGDSHKPETVTKVEQILEGEKVDFLFIDGDHSYEGVKADYEMYKHLVSDEGIIGFHDIMDTDLHHREGCYVDKLWKELKGNKVEFYGPFQRYGIGFIVNGSYVDPVI
jgi:cephalosporin hydroxylase